MLGSGPLSECSRHANKALQAQHLVLIYQYCAEAHVCVGASASQSHTFNVVVILLCTFLCNGFLAGRRFRHDNDDNGLIGVDSAQEVRLALILTVFLSLEDVVPAITIRILGVKFDAEASHSIAVVPAPPPMKAFVGASNHNDFIFFTSKWRGTRHQ